MSGVSLTVVGSINLDIVAGVTHLPAPGETITGATLSRHPGGKGANQALAARRLGADVALVGRVGADAEARLALALLAADGVDLTGVSVDEAAPTGVALIAVAEEGENQIIVAPGANLALTPDRASTPGDGALMLQLELPLETVCAVVAQATGFVCLNLAPAADLPQAVLARADLIVVNEVEAAFYGEALKRAPGLIALTLGARGAELWRGGARVAQAPAPVVAVVDTVGAGDCFVAALTVALLERRSETEALAFACAAGALATTRAGAQPSLPRRAEVEALMARSD